VELSRRWDDDAFVESQKLSVSYPTARLVELVEKIYGSGSPTDVERGDLAKLEAIPNFWETIGVLREERAISVSVVERMWGAALIGEWRAWHEPIQRLRDLRGIESAYIYFQRLATDVEEFEREERLFRRIAARLRPRKRGPGKAFRTRFHARLILHRRRKSS